MQDRCKLDVDEEIKAAQAEVDAASKAYSEAQDRYSEALEAASKAEISCIHTYTDWMNSLHRLHKLTTGSRGGELPPQRAGGPRQH
jgi:hypothetical protein